MSNSCQELLLFVSESMLCEKHRNIWEEAPSIDWEWKGITAKKK